MKRNLLFFLVLGAFLASGSHTSILMAQGAAGAGGQLAQTSVSPQQPQSQTNKPPIPVVVVDYLYLMQIHPVFFAEMNAWEQKVTQANEKIRQEVENLQKMRRELEVLTPGTPDFSQKAEAARQYEAGINLRAMKNNEEAQLEEINIAYKAYQEIKSMVERYAVGNNIYVVINHVDIARRLPAEATVETKSAELAQFPTTVVWRNPNLDITSAIEKWLNDTYEPKGYKSVNFDQLKEQRLANRSANGGAQSQTNVAVGPGQTGR